jgi:hypothetical protein
VDAEVVMNGNITVQGQMIALLRKNIPKLMAQDIVGVQPMGTGTGRIFMVRPDYYTSKYKFSRAKWYVAEFDDKNYADVDEWCAEQFGPHPRRPDAWSRWHHTYHNRIHFAYEKDYILFMLRWS